MPVPYGSGYGAPSAINTPEMIQDAFGLGVHKGTLAQPNEPYALRLITGLPDVSFHDAEVLALRLDRAGPTLQLDLAVVFPEERMLCLRFENVTDVELGGFHEQNVLFDLEVAAAADGLLDVELQSNYGVGGSLRCASIVVA